MISGRWIKHFIITFISSHIIIYPTPINLNYFWSFGSLAGLCLVIQMVSGIFLAMHYIPHVNFAFDSIEHIMRNVNYGWLIRYLHANGASMFFIIVYLHIFRGFYYGSYMYPRRTLWCSGLLIFILMMATAFLGYVLPWGQMSFWGATVITNLFSAIPIYGSSIVEWLWGGFSVDQSTLNRFYSLHYFLPFTIAGLTCVHLSLLHASGSNNPLGINTNISVVQFYPYFVIKDLYALWLFLFVYLYLVFFYPNMLGHPDNYIPADPILTPLHIVPEWYFLPFYAILRSVPDKLGGVLSMFGALACWLILPFINPSEIRSNIFKPLTAYTYWLFIFVFLALGWLGQKPVDYPYVEISQSITSFYFSIFLKMYPTVEIFEDA